MIEVVKKIDKVFEFAWRLSNDDQKASYPRISSKKQLESEMNARVADKDSELLAIYDHRQLIGLCFYFWEVKDKYAQTTGFLIEKEYEHTADKFLQYLHQRLPGYQLHVGVPPTNQEANAYFVKKKAECIEKSIVTRLHDLKKVPKGQGDFLERINGVNFAEYAIFHDQHAIPSEMFWHSENLKAQLDRFRVYALRQEGQICASIFASLIKGSAEIFSLFLDKEYENKGLEFVLIQGLLERLNDELGTIEEICYFIDDNSSVELTAALKAGFKIEDEYNCYRYPL